MCEQCLEHNKGVWYLNDKNYKHDKARFWDKWVMDRLLNYLDTNAGKLRIKNKKMDPQWSGFKKFLINTLYSKIHSGQVIPLEHAIAIARISDDIAIGDCICRKYLKTDRKEGVCLFFNTHAKGAVRKSNLNAKFIDVDTAVEHLKEMSAKGCYHSVWAGPTPFVAILCSCTPSTCLGHQAMNQGIKAGMRKGFFNAEIDIGLCNDCGKCINSCYFNAIKKEENKTIIDKGKCFGCGNCRRVCKRKAIKLVSKK